jgi:uncharacterized protein
MTLEPIAPERVPVTVVVKRTIKPGADKEFEAWLKGATADLSKFPGYLDITLIRPAAGANPEYVLLIRFDSYEHLDAWEGSDIRQEWMRRAQGFTESVANQRITGLEYWFSLPSIPKAFVPPRHKMALVTLLAIYPLSTLIGNYVVPYFPPMHPLLRGLIVSAMLIVLMTYLVMPFMTRVFKSWLFRR